MGLAFHGCDLDIEGVNVDERLSVAEGIMTSYCIMLPLVKDGKFMKKYTYVYSDWDVGHGNNEKGLPDACRELFSFDVMSN